MLAVIEPGGGGCGGRTFNLQHHGGAAAYPGRDPFKHQASRAPASFYLNLSLYLSVLIPRSILILFSHLHHNTSVFRVLCFFACVIPFFCQLAPPRVRQNPSLQHNTPFFDFASINIQKCVFTSAIRTNTRLYERNSANTRLYERNPFKTRVYERSKPRFLIFVCLWPGEAMRKFFARTL